MSSESKTSATMLMGTMEQIKGAAFVVSDNGEIDDPASYDVFLYV